MTKRTHDGRSMGTKENEVKTQFLGISHGMGGETWAWSTNDGLERASAGEECLRCFGRGQRWFEKNQNINQQGDGDRSATLRSPSPRVAIRS